MEDERRDSGSDDAVRLDHRATGPATIVTMSGDGCLENPKKRETSLCLMDS